MTSYAGDDLFELFKLLNNIFSVWFLIKLDYFVSFLLLKPSKIAWF